MANSTKSALGQLKRQLQSVPSEVLNVVPTDLSAIGKCWGVERVIERQLNVAGMVHRFENGKAVVFLKEDDVLGRRRFSWAHELGHIVMAGPESPGVSCRTLGQRDAALERSCDLIATELLMPKLIFSSEADRIGWGLSSVRSLANTFQVTTQATARRLLELMKEPALLSVWRVRPNQTLAQLKLSWSIPNQNARRWKPQVQWRTGPDYLAPLYCSMSDTSVITGDSRLLMRRSGISRYESVQTEAVSMGRGDHRTVIAIHYLSRTSC